MLFQSAIDHQNKGDGVRFYSANSMYIYLYYRYLLCVLAFICIYIVIDTQIIIDTCISTQIKVLLKTNILFNNTADYLLILSYSRFVRHQIHLTVRNYLAGK